jgi:hypothetical protein
MSSKNILVFKVWGKNGYHKIPISNNELRDISNSIKKCDQQLRVRSQNRANWLHLQQRMSL